jgi:hypothetical protein
MVDFQSKYSGEQVEEMLDQIANGEISGGGYDDTEIKGQISDLEATIGDINTILESIING